MSAARSPPSTLQALEGGPLMLEDDPRDHQICKVDPRGENLRGPPNPEDFSPNPRDPRTRAPINRVATNQSHPPDRLFLMTLPPVAASKNVPEDASPFRTEDSSPLPVKNPNVLLTSSSKSKKKHNAPNWSEGLLQASFIY
ncbi:hypothetical protein M407DRAFT_10793 [Tulasnella calospora MUT 4182]|uniref:Uncharacterized protein n=1 Tax=Tulasnella calospora MUT 4182 TaxID=1051891 RepID=A0A0C3LGQ1_9AGAM|nr:hypothetical protein M407DRAFT_10793 [Tulasnella calospora MUT 4182]